MYRAIGGKTRVVLHASSLILLEGRWKDARRTQGDRSVLCVVHEMKLLTRTLYEYSVAFTGAMVAALADLDNYYCLQSMIPTLVVVKLVGSRSIARIAEIADPECRLMPRIVKFHSLISGIMITDPKAIS
jgi:hypothetical protein